MHKNTFFVLASLIVLFALVCASNASARKLTYQERKFYAKNNIIFTKPCNTEADCDPTSQGGGDDGDDQDPPSSTGAQLIVDTAIKMSWPNDSGQCRSSSGYINWVVGSPSGCKTTLTDYAKSVTRMSDGSALQDCGKFVAQVLRHTVDSSFPSVGVRHMIPHMESSSKWRKVSTDGVTFSFSSLQPGDVLAFSKSGGNAREGHIMIYIGNSGGSPRTVKCGSSDCKVYMAEASYQSSTPRLTARRSLVSPSTGISYSVFRYIGT